MELNLKNKTGVITGSGRGIGKAIALAFAKEGVNLVLNDINEEDILKTIKEIKSKHDIKIDYIIGDVSKEYVVDNIINLVKNKFESLDILVNNAGISPKVPFEEISLKQFDRVMEVNIRSIFICCQKVAKEMKKQYSGRIINLSSIAGVYGAKNSAVHYSITKAGILGLTMTLARQLGPYNITINSVAPGRIDTAMTKMLSKEKIERIVQEIPLGRLGSPEDVANCIVFLASKAAGYITGECIKITGFYLP